MTGVVLAHVMHRSFDVQAMNAGPTHMDSPQPGRHEGEVMSSRFAVALFAASLLTPAMALAAGPVAAYDDVQYPNVSATFATSSEVIDTGDVVYPSTPLTITSTLRPRSEDAVASFDDVAYPTADAPARTATPPQRVAKAGDQMAWGHDADGSLACHCTDR